MRLIHSLRLKHLTRQAVQRPFHKLCATLIVGLSLSHGARAEIFPVYDAIGEVGKPNLVASHGFSRFQMINAGQLWPKGGDLNEPDEATVRKVARGASTGGYLIIDIEHWPLETRSTVTEADVANNMRKFIQIVDWMKNENSNVKIGYYLMLPHRSFWTPALYKSNPNNPAYKAKYDAWRAANAKLKPLADRVDVIVPSLYTFYSDQEGWRTYAQENLKEAHQYGKPVIPFICPRFQAATVPAINGHFIPRDFWAMELDTARQFDSDGVTYAQDGIVIWDSPDPKYPWSTTVPWWSPTKYFIDTLKAMPQPSVKFTLGQRIQANAQVGVYDTTSLGAKLLGPQALGARGDVFAGPVAANGKNWWKINYKSGADGWTSEENLIVAPAGLIGHWSFEEASGVLAVDGSDDYNDGRLVNNPTRVAGVAGQGLAMSGAPANRHVLIGNNPAFNFGTGDFTLSVWAKLNPGTTKDAFISKGMVGACCAADGYPGYFLGNQYGNVVLRLENTAPGRNTISTAAISAIPYANKWTHFVGVRKGNLLYLYVNGTLAAMSPPLPDNYNVNNNNAVSFGAQLAYSVFSSLNGSLDEVRIYNGALSTTAITALYNAPRTAP